MPDSPRPSSQATALEPPLRIGVDLAPPPPMCYGLPGEPDFVGFEVDLLQAIGARLGRAITAEAALWAELLERLDTHTLDLICTAVTITPERETRFAFSRPYLATGLTIVSRRDEREPPASPEALGALPSSARIGARINTPAERLARRAAGNGGAHVATFHHNDEVYAALRSGSVAAVVDDWPIGAWFAAQRAADAVTPAAALVAHGIIPGTEARYGLAMRRDDAGLVAAVNGALDAIISDGTYASAYRAWMWPFVGNTCDVTHLL